MFCWDWYLQHSKGLYTAFSPTKAVSFFIQTTKCLFWVSSQMATAWSDPLETADNNYILSSSTIPQLQAYTPLNMVRSHTVLSASEKGQILGALTLTLLLFVCRGKHHQPPCTQLPCSSKPFQWSQLVCKFPVKNHLRVEAIKHKAQISAFRYKTSSRMKSWRLSLASATENIILLGLQTFSESLRSDPGWYPQPLHYTCL